MRNGYFKVLPNLLLQDDPRYIKWRESLKKRPPPWCKGKTKETDPRVKKISEAFKRKSIDNFSAWRARARKEGLIPSSYPPFPRDVRLAFLVGMVLGDGNIHKFPRTEKLTIALGTNNPELIDFVKNVVEKIFNKKSSIYQSKKIKMVRIAIYQKMISKRLGIPAGNRRNSSVGIPSWTWRNKKHLLSCLRGLYEAEASLSIHLPTSTYNFSFHNRNQKLLLDVEKALKILKLHPEIRTYAIRLRKINEVKYFKNLISFRDYSQKILLFD